MKENIGLAFDFIRYIVRNPQEMKNIPDSVCIEFIDTNSPAIKIKNGNKKLKYYAINRNFKAVA